MSGTPGRATAKGNNCLIHSLAQLVHGDFDFDAPGKRICHDAYCERVRAHLVHERGCDPRAHLDFELWAAPIIAAFGRDPEDYSVACYSDQHDGGCRVGGGPVELQVSFPRVWGRGEPLF